MDGLTPAEVLFIAAVGVAIWGAGVVAHGVKVAGHHVKGAIRPRDPPASPRSAVTKKGSRVPWEPCCR